MRITTLTIVRHSVNRQGSTLRVMGVDHLHRSLGWEGCGYHLVIPTGDTVETGKSLEQVGTHYKSHSRYNIGVCYIGGLANDEKTPMDTRTEIQREALQGLLRESHQRFPKALIMGHQDLDPSKSCPCFNVVSESSN